MLRNVTKEFILGAMPDNKKKFLHKEIKGELERRLVALAKKTGLTNNNVAVQAIFEKYDREIGDAKKK